MTSSMQFGAWGLRETSPRRRESPCLAELAWMVETPPAWPVFQASRRSSCFVADFADMDAGRAKSEGLLETFGHGDIVCCVKKDRILGCTLDFPRVFDDHMTLVRVLPNHVGDNGVGERGFP